MSDTARYGQVSVIVPAAGKGERMGALKQYLPINGKPLLQHTLERLLSLNAKRIVLVVSADDDCVEVAPATAACERAIGGATRAESVGNALSSMTLGDNEWVMVHDGARPCIRIADIDRLMDAIVNDEVGGILAVPVVETVKQATAQRISKTVDRDSLWLAQTPQIFRAGVLKKAMAVAVESGIAITDESSAVEHLGLSPILVQGSPDNIKVTTPADLAIAGFYLANEVGP